MCVNSKYVRLQGLCCLSKTFDKKWIAKCPAVCRIKLIRGRCRNVGDSNCYCIYMYIYCYLMNILRFGNFCHIFKVPYQNGKRVSPLCAKIFRPSVTIDYFNVLKVFFDSYKNIYLSHDLHKYLCYFILYTLEFRTSLTSIAFLRCTVRSSRKVYLS